MKMNMKKLAVAAMLTAVAVALSTFSIPIGASKCFPIQHLCNVIAGVFLGPWYGVAMAFCTSLIRNLMGTGSLLAFPRKYGGGPSWEAFSTACTGGCGPPMWERSSARESWEDSCAGRWRRLLWDRRRRYSPTCFPSS